MAMFVVNCILEHSYRLLCCLYVFWSATGCATFFLLGFFSVNELWFRLTGATFTGVPARFIDAQGLRNGVLAQDHSGLFVLKTKLLVEVTARRLRCGLFQGFQLPEIVLDKWRFLR